ncbi:unnamed protein product [Rotaria sordida]|uniref:N-acetyltransferase domain-containing protein n=1 Tax=Rotaria sordida TaxID=392033 RepID=A0A814PJ54_9BILA|nr:unnamed protein product [Rotaria sordida]CAF3841808.1 unnamed protein product [Rotaria sordida]
MIQQITVGDITVSADMDQSIGQYCRLELLNSKTNDTIIQQLYDVFKANEEIHFKYLNYGPFKTIDEFKQFVYMKEKLSSGTVLYTIFVNDIAVGFISYLRINQDQGTIGIGSSRYAAIRLGFQYEDTWLKAEVCKGRSRDNSWYSIIDDEWPQIKEELQRWLNPENFDMNGQQLTKLNASQINPRHTKIIDVN